MTTQLMPQEPLNNNINQANSNQCIFDFDDELAKDQTNEEKTKRQTSNQNAVLYFGAATLALYLFYLTNRGNIQSVVDYFSPSPQKKNKNSSTLPISPRLPVNRRLVYT